MAGIMLPSLQKTTETKAHKSSAKNPHQGNNFAELVKAKSHSSTEARKNNQPARTALAEGPEQEKRSDRSPHNAANNNLVMLAPSVMTLQTPSPQVLGGRRSVVAATPEKGVHPKTSLAPAQTVDTRNAQATQATHTRSTQAAQADQAAIIRSSNSLPKVKQHEENLLELRSVKLAAEPVIKSNKLQGLPNLPHLQTDNTSDARLRKPETATKTQSMSSSLIPAQVDVAQTRSSQLALQIKPASAPAPTHQVAGLIVHAAKDGLSKAEMVLHPEGLGTVQVSLSLDASGVMQATVVADPAALQALHQDLDNLVQALQNAGIQMGDLQLQARDQQNPDQDFSQTPGMQQIGITNEADGDLGLLPINNLNLTALIQGGAKLDLFI